VTAVTARREPWPTNGGAHSSMHPLVPLLLVIFLRSGGLAYTPEHDVRPDELLQ
jgi:hypothetical protein